METRFDFSSTEVALIINGVDCTLDVGDASLQDRLLQAAEAVQGIAPGEAPTNIGASERLRGIVAAVLGEEATARIYQDVAPNLYKDVELILFLRRVMDDAVSTKRFEATMSALDAVIGADD